MTNVSEIINSEELTALLIFFFDNFKSESV
jgi:hypothetical protein